MAEDILKFRYYSREVSYITYSRRIFSGSMKEILCQNMQLLDISLYVGSLEFMYISNILEHQFTNPEFNKNEKRIFIL